MSAYLPPCTIAGDVDARHVRPHRHVRKRPDRTPHDAKLDALQAAAAARATA